ncbi:MAG: AMP-binding protein, partial [Methylococcaceae bacterium]|nr:AMP-binding protein [Methylococcaceae bacterium]
MNILSEIQETCFRQPDRIALIQDDCSLLYRDLGRRAQGFAGLLNRHLRDERPVAVALDRGIEACIVLLAIVHAGRCYLPLDLKNPRDRLETITQDAQVSAVIGKGPCPDWVKPPAKWIEFENLAVPS